MYEYKVFKWRFDNLYSEDLENTLNEHAKDGWRVFRIVTSLGLNGNESTVILEKVTEK